MPKEYPPEPALPWYVRAMYITWEWVSWPFYVRMLKKAGFRRTGWMTWETGPEGEGELWPS